MTTISDQTGKPRRRKTGGRRAGTPNKVTCTFRAAVAALLEAKSEDMGRWLDQVANGTPAHVHDDGSITPGQPPNPGKALDIIAKLAEYAAPKLARVELGAAGDRSMSAPIKIEFVTLSESM